jgi:hypothetical protein
MQGKGKRCFFEKKQQKTFGLGAWALTPPAPPGPKIFAALFSKSACLLFGFLNSSPYRPARSA